MEISPEWFDEFKWLFGGVGGALLVFVLGLLVRKKKKDQKPSNQTSGDKSPIINIGDNTQGNTVNLSGDKNVNKGNISAGGDVHIGDKS